MGNNKIIGAKIKNIRESKQLSIEEVAERSGLGIEQIERIEGNLDFPSLAPLIKIARVLGVRLGTFLDDQAELGPVVCRKKGQRGRWYRVHEQRDTRTQAYGLPLALTR